MLIVLGGATGCGSPEKVVEPIEKILPLPAGRVGWRPWSERDSASALRRPMLLFLYTERSFWCREMVKHCFEDAQLAREVDRATFPIRIDADQRPDLAERYGMGGFPSTVFLTPEGDWITGGTYLDRDDFQRLLGRVRIYIDIPERREDLERERRVLAGRLAQKARKSPPPVLPPTPGLFRRCLDSTVVVLKRGGWPGEEAVMMVLESGDPAERTTALEVLERLVESPLHDRDGTFFLAPLTDDWEVVDREKHLGRNAGLLVLFCLAARESGNNAFRDTALRLGDALLERFYVPRDTLFAAGWAQARDEAYYSGWNALAVSGLAALYGVTKDPRYLEISRGVLDVLKRRMAHPGGGVRHGPGRQDLLLLEDQALLARAALDLDRVDKRAEDVQLARGLADLMVKRFGTDSGALKDRHPEPGSAVSPAIDRFLPSGNGVAVQVLVRLDNVPADQAARGILTALLGTHLSRSAYTGALNRGLGLYLK